YLNATGQLDARCLHAGTPVARGDKWIATKWLRQRPYVGA
ncbi:MAG: 2-oxoglutarate-dependent dioxygenase, partial [Lautropia sp.]